MSFQEKRKNGAIPGWLMLVVGIVLGVVITLAVQRLLPASTSAPLPVQNVSDEALNQTATAIIIGATQAADTALTPMSELDMTATSIISQATELALTPSS